MKILVTNDDGVHAPCLRLLQKILAEVAEQVIVVAPAEERSTTGHSLNIKSPLFMRELDKDFYACEGFPADCVFVGSLAYFKSPPDLVISGINRGGNLGQDTFYSGTVAAAREASFHGIPSISTSLVTEFCNDFKDISEDFLNGALFLKNLIRNKIHNFIPDRTLININVPFIVKPKGAKVTSLGFRKYAHSILEGENPRKRPFYWIGSGYQGFDKFESDKITDCQCVDQGFISVTPIDFLNSYPYNLELHKILERTIICC